jgi:hypothetical protein
LTIGDRLIPASFDPASTKEGFQNKELIFTEPAFADSELQNAAQLANNVAVIFCSRTVTYLEQVCRAVEANAAGVLLVNSDTDHPDRLLEFPFSIGREPIAIPVVAISQNMAVAIRERELCSCKYSPPGKNKLSRVLIN